jgi:hypothetical protein
MNSRSRSSVDRSTRIPFAADCFAGATVPDQFEEVSAEAWLASYNLKAAAVIREHSHYLPGYNAALTLLFEEEFIEYKSDYVTD